LRAGRLPGVEVEGKRGFVIPGAGSGLGGVVQPQRADQRDPEDAGGVDDQLGRRVTRIDQVLAGQQLPFLQLLMDRVSIAESGTVASVVATPVIRFGRSPRSSPAAGAGPVSGLAPG